RCRAPPRPGPPARRAPTARRPPLPHAPPPAPPPLYQNSPTPSPPGARASTCIWFDLAEGGPVTLAILDLRGGPVRRFIPGLDFGDVLGAGSYGRGGTGGPTCDPRRMWDGRADAGRAVHGGRCLANLTGAAG